MLAFVISVWGGGWILAVACYFDLGGCLDFAWFYATGLIVMIGFEF